MNERCRESIQRVDVATAKRFEDLRCWQTGRQLTNLVYDYSEEGAFANQFEEAYALADKASREVYRFIQYLESRTDDDRVQETPVQCDVSDDLLGDGSDA